MTDILARMEEMGIIPVVKIEQVDKAAALAAALRRGGLMAAEITFRTAGADQVIRAMRETFPDMLIGAGTVLNTEQAAQAISAGAQFIVSPGLNPEVVRYVRERNILMLPGCCTPSDVERALSLGVETVKFFPAQAAGGLEMIRALSAPYGAVRFMPTGGITAENVRTYLDFPAVVACGGSWMVPPRLIGEGRFDEIARLSAGAVAAVLDFRVAAAGYYQPQVQQDAGRELALLLGLLPGEEKQPALTGVPVEFSLPAGAASRPGYLVISTADLRRAQAYLRRRGIIAAQAEDSGRALLRLDQQVYGLDLYLQQA